MRLAVLSHCVIRRGQGCATGIWKLIPITRTRTSHRKKSFGLRACVRVCRKMPRWCQGSEVRLSHTGNRNTNDRINQMSQLMTAVLCTAWVPVNACTDFPNICSPQHNQFGGWGRAFSRREVTPHLKTLIVPPQYCKVLCGDDKKLLLNSQSPSAEFFKPKPNMEVQNNKTDELQRHQDK